MRFMFAALLSFVSAFQTDLDINPGENYKTP